MGEDPFILIEVYAEMVYFDVLSRKSTGPSEKASSLPCLLIVDLGRFGRHSVAQGYTPLGQKLLSGSRGLTRIPTMPARTHHCINNWTRWLSVIAITQA